MDEIKVLKGYEYQLLLDQIANMRKLIELYEQQQQLHAGVSQPPDADWHACPDIPRCQALLDQIRDRYDRYVWDTYAVRPSDWL